MFGATSEGAAFTVLDDISVLPDVRMRLEKMKIATYPYGRLRCHQGYSRLFLGTSSDGKCLCCICSDCGGIRQRPRACSSSQHYCPGQGCSVPARTVAQALGGRRPPPERQLPLADRAGKRVEISDCQGNYRRRTHRDADQYPRTGPLRLSVNGASGKACAKWRAASASRRH